MIRGALAAASVLLCLACAACQRSTAALDLHGTQVDPLAVEAPATVLVFVASDCPISNRYAPELKRIATELAPRGARSWLVYPNAQDSAAVIEAHTRAYDYGMRALRDPQHVLVKRVGARVTPEVAVLDRSQRVAYLGRVDDRYERLGAERPAARTHDLEDALRALLSGKPIATPRTTAVGCAISD